MASTLSRLLRGAGPPVEPPDTWRVVLSGLLTLLGLGLSVYLTVVHFLGNQLLACPTSLHSSGINCEKVITSPQSYVFGIPVAVLGLVFYGVLAAVNSPWAWRAADRRIHLARLLLLVVGIGFVLYLVSAELLIIKAICIYCTGVHIVTFAQLLLVVATVPPMLGWGAARPATPAPAKRRPAPASQETNGGARRPQPARTPTRRNAPAKSGAGRRR